ncbi:hypothetical protein K502DRAFT_323934 [Neoconidiobolus thromboides FSU 785]|nr:hypothetical protein K502DRAFT_323934 [Neoconidiobolus thromboides FSU 785]
MKCNNCYEGLVRANELTVKVTRNCELIPNNRGFFKPLIDICKEGQTLISSVINQYGDILTLWLENTQYYSEIANYNSILEGCMNVIDLFNNLNSFTRIMQYSKYELSLKELLDKYNTALKAIEKVPINKISQLGGGRKPAQKVGKVPAIDINSGIINFEGNISGHNRMNSYTKKLPNIAEGTYALPTLRESINEYNPNNVFQTKSSALTSLSKSPPGTALSFDEEYLVDDLANAQKYKSIPIRKTDSMLIGTRHIPSLLEDYSFNQTKITGQGTLAHIELNNDMSLPLIIEDSFFYNDQTNIKKEIQKPEVNVNIKKGLAPKSNELNSSSIKTDQSEISDIDLSGIEDDMLEEPDSLQHQKVNQTTIDDLKAVIYETNILELSLANYREIKKDVVNPQELLEEALKFHSQSTTESRSKAFDKFQYIHTQYSLPQATYFLGYYYYWGYAVSKDRERALDYFTEASQNGSSDAMDHLGIHYTLNGNHTRAYEYYQLASMKNNSKALYHLYECYLHGLGIEKSVTEALVYLKRAAKNGHPKACKKVENYIREAASTNAAK